MKMEAFYDQITGYFRELEKRISLFQVIALLLSFYVWSLLFKWCRLASVSCSSLVNAFLYTLFQPSLACWKGQMTVGRLLCSRTSLPVASFTSWRHLHVWVATWVLPGREVGIGHFSKWSEAHGFGFKNKTWTIAFLRGEAQSASHMSSRLEFILSCFPRAKYSVAVC